MSDPTQFLACVSGAASSAISGICPDGFTLQTVSGYLSTVEPLTRLDAASSGNLTVYFFSLAVALLSIGYFSGFILKSTNLARG